MTQGRYRAGGSSADEASGVAGAGAGGGAVGGWRPTPLLAVALVIGLWALLPPYTGPHLETETKNEIADHVVPSILLLALWLTAVLGGYRSSLTMLALGLGIVLAGLWMTATHVALVAQALRDEVGWGATLWHTLPGLAVLAVGAAWAWRYLRDEDEVAA